jgi:hypothetical protein
MILLREVQVLNKMLKSDPVSFRRSLKVEVLNNRHQLVLRVHKLHRLLISNLRRLNPLSNKGMEHKEETSHSIRDRDRHRKLVLLPNQQVNRNNNNRSHKSNTVRGEKVVLDSLNSQNLSVHRDSSPLLVLF